MKRLILLLILGSALLLSACTSQKPTPDAGTATWNSARWDSAKWAR